MKKPVLLLLGSLLCACARPASTPPPDAEAPSVPVVKAAGVATRPVPESMRLPGELLPYQAAVLYPRVSGFVEEVLVDRGSAVRRGQLLLRLSAPELAAQRAEAEAKTAADRSTFARLRAASATQGAVAMHDIELADAAVKADEDHTRALRTLEEYLLMRAPFDGMVTERDVHPGALVGPAAGPHATALLHIEQVSRLRLQVAVPEREAGAVAEGTVAEFSVSTWPGQRFTGIIRRIAHSLDVRTRTMPVELDVDNRDGKLAPGMYAEVSFPASRDAATR